MPSFSDLISGRFGGGVNDPNRRTSNNGSGRGGTVSRSVTRAAPQVARGGSSSNVPTPQAKPTTSGGRSGVDPRTSKQDRMRPQARTTSPGVSRSRFDTAFEDVQGAKNTLANLQQERLERKGALRAKADRSNITIDNQPVAPFGGSQTPRPKPAAPKRPNIDDRAVFSGPSRSVPRSKPGIDNRTVAGGGRNTPVSNPRRGPMPTPRAKPPTPAARVSGAFGETMFGVNPDLQDILQDKAKRRKPGIF